MGSESRSKDKPSNFILLPFFAYAVVIFLGGIYGAIGGNWVAFWASLILSLLFVGAGLAVRMNGR